MNLHPCIARNNATHNNVTHNNATPNNVITARIPGSTFCRNLSHAGFITPLLLALIATPLMAATEFEDSVPIELVRLFLGNPGIGEATIYQDVMDEFPPFTVPNAFEVMGSLDQVYSQRVVLRTDLDEDAAKTAITEAFTSSGWQEIDLSNFRPAQQGGFVSATQPELPVQVCHDSYGTMQVSVSTSPEGQLIHLSRSTAAMMGNFAGGFGNTSPCDPGRFGPGNMMGPGGRGSVSVHMPTLVMPEAPAGRNYPVQGFFSGGGGGSSDDFETRTPLASELSLQELYEHFATQIVEQGWVADNASTGSFLATGSFTKTVEGDVDLIGILNVLEVAENGFDLKFRILRKGRGNPATGARIIDAPALGIQGRAP